MYLIENPNINNEQLNKILNYIDRTMLNLQSHKFKNFITDEKVSHPRNKSPYQFMAHFKLVPYKKDCGHKACLFINSTGALKTIK